MKMKDHWNFQQYKAGLSRSTELELATGERNDLFNISKQILNAIPLERLTNKDNPVIISANGSSGSGKKILFDGMIDGEEISLSQVPEGGAFNHHCIIEKFGLPIEMSYVDTADFADCKFLRPTSRGQVNLMLKDLLEHRRHGGIIFLQNFWGEEDIFPDIDFWLEGKDDRWFLADFKSRISEASQPVQDALNAAFNRASENSEEKNWARYMRIRVSDPSIISTDFMSSIFAKLKEQYELNYPSSE